MIPVNKVLLFQRFNLVKGALDIKRKTVLLCSVNNSDEE